jgi:hypothetical protein
MNEYEFEITKCLTMCGINRDPISIIYNYLKDSIFTITYSVDNSCADKKKEKEKRKIRVTFLILRSSDGGNSIHSSTLTKKLLVQVVNEKDENYCHRENYWSLRKLHILYLSIFVRGRVASGGAACVANIGDKINYIVPLIARACKCSITWATNKETNCSHDKLVSTTIDNVDDHFRDANFLYSTHANCKFIGAVRSDFFLCTSNEKDGAIFKEFIDLTPYGLDICTSISGNNFEFSSHFWKDDEASFFNNLRF